MDESSAWARSPRSAREVGCPSGHGIGLSLPIDIYGAPLGHTYWPGWEGLHLQDPWLDLQLLDRHIVCWPGRPTSGHLRLLSARNRCPGKLLHLGRAIDSLVSAVSEKPSLVLEVLGEFALTATRDGGGRVRLPRSDLPVRRSESGPGGPRIAGPAVADPMMGQLTMVGLFLSSSRFRPQRLDRRVQPMRRGRRVRRGAKAPPSCARAIEDQVGHVASSCGRSPSTGRSTGGSVPTSLRGQNAVVFQQLGSEPVGAPCYSPTRGRLSVRLRMERARSPVQLTALCQSAELSARFRGRWCRHG